MHEQGPGGSNPGSTPEVRGQGREGTSTSKPDQNPGSTQVLVQVQTYNLDLNGSDGLKAGLKGKMKGQTNSARWGASTRAGARAGGAATGTGWRWRFGVGAGAVALQALPLPLALHCRGRPSAGAVFFWGRSGGRWNWRCMRERWRALALVLVLG